jgi:hypothetical protein
MSIDQFLNRHRFACFLVALHTLLVGAWAWIELNDAWNDMNPTMLVWVAFRVFDYPIHVILHPLIDNVGHTGNYLAATLVLGGAYWFAIGTFAAQVSRWVRRLPIWRRPAHG